MTFQDVVDAAVAFGDTYGIYVTASIIVGLGLYAVRRLLKSGR